MQTPGRVVSPHHLTQNVQRGGQSSIQGHANRRLVYKIYIYIYIFFFFQRSLLRFLERETLIITVPRLAGDCGLNGTREFTWGPVCRWVTTRHVDWAAVAVAAAPWRCESWPIIPERTRRDGECVRRFFTRAAPRRCGQLILSCIDIPGGSSNTAPDGVSSCFLPHRKKYNNSY